jgi:molecular chaperone DnaK (HSP70)
MTGERVREAALSTPVESFETYRAELLAITRRLGMKRVRFVDEPVAAALGYGLSLARERLILVVDFGGGTFHLALVVLNPKGAAEGAAAVLAKEGRPVGGNLVDRWILKALCEKAGLPGHPEDAEEDPETYFWLRLMLDEARRAKEALFFSSVTTFLMAPPAHRRRPSAGVDKLRSIEWSRAGLIELLRTQGLYRTIDECL